MDKEKFKLTIHLDDKTLEALEEVADWTDYSLEKTAALILSFSADKIKDLYWTIFLAPLGADQ